MMKTLAARLLFAPNDFEDARQISDELGNKTVKARSRSMPGLMGGGKGRGPTVSTSDQRRALMNPDEVKQMGQSRQILLLENLRPVFCHKIRYFTDKRFTKRLLPPPVVAAIDLRQAARGRTDDHFGMWGDHVLQGQRAHTPAPASTASKEGVQTSAHVAPSVATVAEDAEDEAFSLDFSNVRIPEAKPKTAEEISREVNLFLDQLEAA